MPDVLNTGFKGKLSRVYAKLQELQLKHKWFAPVTGAVMGGATGAYVGGKDVPEEHVTNARLLGGITGALGGGLSGYLIDRSVRAYTAPEALAARARQLNALSKHNVSQALRDAGVPETAEGVTKFMAPQPINADFNTAALGSFVGSLGAYMPWVTNKLYKTDTENA